MPCEACGCPECSRMRRVITDRCPACGEQYVRPVWPPPIPRHCEECEPRQDNFPAIAAERLVAVHDMAEHLIGQIERLQEMSRDLDDAIRSQFSEEDFL